MERRESKNAAKMKFKTKKDEREILNGMFEKLSNIEYYELTKKR